MASSLACLVTSIGIFAIGQQREWAESHSALFKGFAAGMLITITLLHIMPKASQMNGWAHYYMLAGFLSIYLINRLLRLYVCRGESCPEPSLGLIPALGIGLHSLIDGVIYSVTFNVSILTGALAAIGMIFHEFPEGIVTYVLLVERGGIDHRKSLIYAFLTAAFSTPLGTLVSFPFINDIGPPALGMLLGLSAGVLAYVGASHLLPEVESENEVLSILTVGAGVLVGVLIIALKG